eukprot:CFRG7643T1
MTAHLLLTFLASLASAAVINVQPGLESLVVAVKAAQAEDVLQLEKGEYGYFEPDFVINVPISIIGDASGGTIIQADSTMTPVILRSLGWNVKLKYLSFADAGSLNVCKLELPIALHGESKFKLTTSTLENGLVNVKADLGQWYNDRTVKEFSYEKCVWSPEIADPAISTVESGINPANCHGHFQYSVEFDMMLTSCGVVKAQDEEFVTFDASTDVVVSEVVEWETPQVSLPFPEIRSLNALSNLRVQLGRKFTEISQGTVVSIDYDAVDMEVIVSQQVLPSVGDALAGSGDVSTIVITVTLPNMYTITNSAFGSIKILNSTNPENKVSQWRLLSSECNDKTEIFCRQEIQFEMKACQLTSTLGLQGVPVKCQIGAGESCQELSEDDALADITISLNSNDFCVGNNVELEADFVAMAELRDASFKEQHDMATPIAMQDTLFVAFPLWTNTSGLIIENGHIVQMERTSPTEGVECENFPFLYVNDSINQLVQNFIAGNPPEIHTEFILDNEMACVEPSGTFFERILDMTYVIQVSYTSQSALQQLRRRTVYASSKRGRRTSVDKSVEQAVVLQGTESNDKDVIGESNGSLQLALWGVGGAFIAIFTSGCFFFCIVYCCLKMKSKKVHQAEMKRYHYQHMMNRNSNAGSRFMTDSNADFKSWANDIYEEQNHRTTNINDFDDMPYMPYDDEHVSIDAYDQIQSQNGPTVASL